MLRKLNFTDRIRIPKNRVEIMLSRDSDRILRFDATLDLSALKLDPGERVIVEAYYRTSLMRFDAGTVSTTKLPDNRRLADLDTDRVVHFRVKVVSAAEPGRVVALADDITLTDRRGDDQEMSLLPVNFVELGELPWRLDFSTAGVTLEMNRAIDGMEALARSDLRVAGLVYPAAAREVLTRILIADGRSAADDSDEWWALWLRWAAELASDPPPDGDDPVDKMIWIESVIAAFSARHEFAARFNATMEGER